MSPTRSHCVNGHPLVGDNIVIRYSHGRPSEKCRTCKRAEVQRHNRKTQGTAKHKAWKKIANLRRYGLIDPQPCAECGAPEAVAHHFNGYEGEAVLQVVWLCRKHHAARHRTKAA